MTKIGLLIKNQLEYSDFPFNPNKNYPEIQYKYQPQPSNTLYGEMRNVLNKMGYDSENFNTKEWNPFGVFINKGDKVLIKPNFVLYTRKNPFTVITHPSILRFIIDYTFIATGSTGKVIVGDAPQMNADINELLECTKLPKLIELLQKNGVPVKFLDFRGEIVEVKKGIWIVRDKGEIKDNHIIVDIGRNSLLYALEKEGKDNFYGAEYNRKIVNYHHSIYRNEYSISKTLLDSDVVISVPKLKTHKKVGVTLNLKNFVGINTHKNYLPHYRIGSPSLGGDSYPSMNSFLDRLKFLNYIFRDWFLSPHNSRLGRFFHRLLGYRRFIEYLILKLLFPKFQSYYKLLYDGNWQGNDTVWRTVLDLNIILRYINKKGILENKVQRKFFSVIDGIIGGENEGPLKPTEKKSRIVLFGKNLLETDLVATKIMGFDYKDIPLLKNALALNEYTLLENNSLNSMKIFSNRDDLNGISYDELNLNLNFVPPIGWLSLKRPK